MHALDHRYDAIKNMSNQCVCVPTATGVETGCFLLYLVQEDQLLLMGNIIETSLDEMHTHDSFEFSVKLSTDDTGYKLIRHAALRGSLTIAFLRRDRYRLIGWRVIESMLFQLFPQDANPHQTILSFDLSATKSTCTAHGVELER